MDAIVVVTWEVAEYWGFLDDRMGRMGGDSGAIGGGAGERIRYYVTHGIPFLQLTPFRSQASRYSSESVARRVADMAADTESPRGVEQLPRRLTR
jgi:hypothetical protein